MSDTRIYYLIELDSLDLLSEAERQELNAWMEADPANRGSYEEMIQILKVGSLSLAAVDVQTDAEWAKLSAALEAPANAFVEDMPFRPVMPAATLRPPFWSRGRVWSAAAAIAVLAVVGSYFAFFQSGPKPIDALHFATALGESKEIKLADGSLVHLNGGSTLDAAAGYGASDRRLKLHGEAYFEVAKDKDRPFVVAAGATEAEALGTKFNVRMTNGDALVQLSVTEGRVRFSNAQFPELILTAGQVATFDPQRGFARDAVMAAHETAGWVEQKLVFKGTLFPIAAQQIERAYGVTLLFPDRLKELPLNATFDHKSLSEVLDVIAISQNLKATQDGKVVTLSE